MSQKNSSMQEMLQTSYLSGTSAAYIEELYEAYLQDPASVDDKWRRYFEQLPQVNGQSGADISHAKIKQQFLTLANAPKQAVQQADPAIEKQAKVMQLINAYRLYGHRHADIDPLHIAAKPELPNLSLDYYGLTASDMNTQFVTDTALFNSSASLQQIYTALQETYCARIGFEYLHITEPEEVVWLQQRIEAKPTKTTLSSEQKRHVLDRLVAAEGLEKYLARKYVGQKRFSLEGGETLIPLMDQLIERAAGYQVKETVIGMAHRGRLNVLVNILGKAPATLFDEFEGRFTDNDRLGDVKYHIGYSSDVTFAGNPMHLVLAFNPSHLEIVAPVVEGSVRARQQRRQDGERSQVLPIVLHGDAAFAGQGVVMETFNMSQARGYTTGGTVHIVINNQVGFTTSNPHDARSTLYCTDIAKMVQAPIFHVNADDPEAAYYVAQLALDYRMQFKKDVVIDLICYRRHGHNEADEPSATQPLMYKIIKQHASTAKLYADKLIQNAALDAKGFEQLEEDYRKALDAGKPVVDINQAPADNYRVDWAPFLNQPWKVAANTAVNSQQLHALTQALQKLPTGFKVQPQVARELENRKKMAAAEQDLNWGFGETMAYASLLAEGYAVRISGQDVGRGTFAHRHAVLHEQETGKTYIPLQHLAENQGQFTIIDSILSEVAVLGFEYGYATAEPKALVIWEAQFGDFVNGAQVVIDQFLSSGEQKWGRLCGLVMLLPHGHEGAGPEHTSARPERFLQLCAQENMQVCVPTTPAQIFHLLRRQMVRPYRKPLVVMTPKSLLRHKLATSKLSELMDGEFQLLIPEQDAITASAVKRVIICAGKVYYDLLEKRREQAKEDVAIIRLEQLYPFPQDMLKAELAKYKAAKQIIWCQEEPKNQGYWLTMQDYLRTCLIPEQELSYIGRDALASPSEGHTNKHVEQQAALVKQALGI
jgi:2-oxoglutarate dehydrogenase E1 component